MAVFWDVAPCSLVEVCRRFRGASCLHQSSGRSTRLQGATSQKTSSYSPPWGPEISWFYFNPNVHIGTEENCGSLGKDSWPPNRNLKPGPPELEAGVSNPLTATFAIKVASSTNSAINGNLRQLLWSSNILLCVCEQAFCSGRIR
jgi:hypothetical protein